MALGEKEEAAEEEEEKKALLIEELGSVLRKSLISQSSLPSRMRSSSSGTNRSMGTVVAALVNDGEDKDDDGDGVEEVATDNGEGFVGEGVFFSFRFRILSHETKSRSTSASGREEEVFIPLLGSLFVVEDVVIVVVVAVEARSLPPFLVSPAPPPPPSSGFLCSLNRLKPFIIAFRDEAGDLGGVDDAEDDLRVPGGVLRNATMSTLSSPSSLSSVSSSMSLLPLTLCSVSSFFFFFGLSSLLW